MGMCLNPGNRMFQMMLNSSFYVDKTGLAAFTNAKMCRDGRFVCVSRPRRFGKSVDADMLVAYWSRGCDSRAQFEGLEVSRDASYVADALQRAHSWAAGPLYYNNEQALRAAVKFAYLAAVDDYLRIDELPGGQVSLPQRHKSWAASAKTRACA